MKETVSRKKIIRSDILVFMLVLLLLFGSTAIMGYMEHTLRLITSPVQFAVFFVIIVICYFMLTRRMTSYQYVLNETGFIVYRYVGKKRKVAEQVLLHDVLFVAPYTQARGDKGREFALCVTKKQDAVVIAHLLEGKRQWLIVSIGRDMCDAIEQACREQRAKRK